MNSKLAAQMHRNAIVILATCINDSKPDYMEVTDWIEKGRTYIVRGMSHESIHGRKAIAIEDFGGKHIKPNEDVDVIKLGRFKLATVCQN